MLALHKYCQQEFYFMWYVQEPRKQGTVVILGAGASYGAHLPCTPPIMKNFVKEGLRRVKYNYDSLWKLLEKLGYDFSTLEEGRPNLEEIYTLLDIVSSGLWHNKEEEYISDLGKEFWKIPPVYFLESFIIEVTWKPSFQAINTPCIYHDKIVSHLEEGDTIISFNYDLIADASVSKLTEWNELGGYGFLCYELLKDTPEYLRKRPSKINLLKLHGSLNWEPKEQFPAIHDGKEFWNLGFHDKLLGQKEPSYKISIKKLNEINDKAYYGLLPIESAKFYQEYATRVPDDKMHYISGVEKPKLETFIIPPTLYKLTGQKVSPDLAEVWAKARNALIYAKKIICIGYSFPQTDLHFSTLFRLAMGQNRNKNLEVILIDPTDISKKNIRSIGLKGNFTHMNITFQDFVNKYL